MPSQLEPTGLDRGDGKYPDGATIIPWRSGKHLVWDVTCPDTFAPSYVSSATSQPGAMASLAEEKMSKYSYLTSTHLFTPVADETSGVFGPMALDFVKELGEPPQHSVWGQLLTPSPVSTPGSGRSEGQCGICDGIHGPSSLDGSPLNWYVL